MSSSEKLSQKLESLEATNVSDTEAEVLSGGISINQVAHAAHQATQTLSGGSGGSSGGGSLGGSGGGSGGSPLGGILGN
jgi:hypothetical protein